jgi:hypothetical protein
MANQPDNKTIKVLEITSRPESFCRAGRRWTRIPVQVPIDDLTKDEIKALKSEKELAVVEKDVVVAEDKK